MLDSMIEEKTKFLTNIENDLISLGKDFTDLSGQVVMTGKMINVKEESLEKLKKEYKDLFSKHKYVKRD